MQIGQAIVDFESHQIDGPAGHHTVEPIVMEVLAALVKNAGEVVTRDDLIDTVWGVGYGGDERLSRAISLLRKALGDSTNEDGYIQTIPKTGYKLTVEITPPAGTEIEELGALETPSLDATTVTQTNKIRPGWLAALAAGIVALIALVYIGQSMLFTSEEPPLVIIMDSAHPSRIYDDQVIADGATNADILSDILGDLPIRTQKELISPSWHRYEAITQFQPDLIVIHYSGFKQEDASGDRPKLRLLVEYFLKTDTKFLVYSRATEEWLDGNMNIILEQLYADNPELKDRIDIFPLDEYGEPYWMDQTTSQAIKLKIKEILKLE